MTGLPTLQVQLDNGTGTFPFDITSKCLLEPGFSFTRGRDDWQGGVSAASISLTMNNSDGRFTPGSTILASPTPIKVDQRIRIRETINGITFNRFTGYVKSWPVAWPATVATFSTVQITATDAQARLERQALRSVVEEEVLKDAPTAYYTLTEATGATAAADSSGSGSPLLTMAGTGAAVTFGTGAGPVTAGAPVATFAGGKYLEGPSVSAIPVPFEAWFTTTTNDAVSRVVVSNGFRLLNGHLFYNGVDLGLVADGLPHRLAYDDNGSVAYLDNVATAVAYTGSATDKIQVGGAPGAASFIGSIGYFAYWIGLQAPDLSRHYTAGTTGFAGESGTARLTRTLGYANLSVGTLDTSLTTMAFADITGASVWSALQQVADAEGGVVFIDGSGNLTFHNRNRPAAKTSPDLLLTAASVTPDAQPVTDDQQILNYIEASSETTGAAQLVQNVASIAAHGKYPNQLTFLVQTDQEALDRANWLVANYAEPTTRYGTLTINLFGMTASLAQSVLSAIEINCWLRITGAPSQTPGSTTIDVVVEGYTEELTADSWTLSCNVVSRSVFTAWILGDATQSVLGSTTKLYV